MVNKFLILAFDRGDGCSVLANDGHKYKNGIGLNSQEVPPAFGLPNR